MTSQALRDSLRLSGTLPTSKAVRVLAYEHIPYKPLMYFICLKLAGESG
jgi:hypothetical protein